MGIAASLMGKRRDPHANRETAGSTLGTLPAAAGTTRRLSYYTKSSRSIGSSFGSGAPRRIQASTMRTRQTIAIQSMRESDKWHEDSQ